MTGAVLSGGKRGLATVDLLQLDAMGVLDDKAEYRIEGADAIDLGEGTFVLLESLGLRLAALQDAPDTVNELLLFLDFFVECCVVGELLFACGGHDCLFFLSQERKLTINALRVR